MLSNTRTLSIQSSIRSCTSFAIGMAAYGTWRTIAALRQLVRYWTTADVGNLTKSDLAAQLNVDASSAEANGNSRQNLGTGGLVFWERTKADLGWGWVVR